MVTSMVIRFSAQCHATAAVVKANNVPPPLPIEAHIVIMTSPSIHVKKRSCFSGGVEAESDGEGSKLMIRII